MSERDSLISFTLCKLANLNVEEQEQKQEQEQQQQEQQQQQQEQDTKWDDQVDKNLEILIIGPIFSSFLNFVNAIDIINFLSICSFLVTNSCCWDILLNKLQLKEKYIEMISARVFMEKTSSRKICLFVMNQLGFVCNQCLTPLDGHHHRHNLHNHYHHHRHYLLNQCNHHYHHYHHHHHHHH